ncbi:hypothetical protein N9D02_08540 [Emcibacteraceae bacterium]|nr:hypothetical protein [Emcibacteraceae bacterium]
MIFRSGAWIISLFILIKLSTFWKIRYLRYLHHIVSFLWAILVLTALSGTALNGKNRVDKKLISEHKTKSCLYRAYQFDPGAIGSSSIQIIAEYEILYSLKVEKKKLVVFRGSNPEIKISKDNHILVQIGTYNPHKEDESHLFQTEIESCLTGKTIYL